MAKKKNYSKKAGGPGLMAALSDYQREHKQKETYKPKNTPKLDSNRATNNTTQAFSRGNNFGALLKPKEAPKPKQEAPKPKPEAPKPRTMQSNPPPLNRPGGSGTHGRPLPSNPQLGMSVPKRENFKTREAYMRALERYTKLKNRAKRTAAGSRNSASSGTTRVTDGRQYGR